MPKLKLGDEFDDQEKDDEVIDDDSEGKEKDQEDKSGDEDDDNDASADTSTSEDDEDDDDKEQQEKIDAINNDDTKTDEEKVRELEGLKKAEQKIDADVSELDLDIKKAKDRVVNKRQDRRDKRDLVRNIDDKYPKEDEDDLSDIDKETLDVLDRYTRSKGLVPKTELQKIKYEDAHKDAETTFFESHPEYSPANDKDDFLYNALMNELSIYAAPKDSRLIPKLFERAHKAVKDANPEFFKKSISADELVKKKARTKKSAMGGGSSGGGTGSGNKSDKSSKGDLNANQIAALRAGGWSEDEIKNF